MRTSFSDLVGSAVESPHKLGGNELTDLTPDLETTAAGNNAMAAEATRAAATGYSSTPNDHHCC